VSGKDGEEEIERDNICFSKGCREEKSGRMNRQKRDLSTANKNILSGQSLSLRFDRYVPTSALSFQHSHIRVTLGFV
jgi:hypothetical protein